MTDDRRTSPSEPGTGSEYMECFGTVPPRARSERVLPWLLGGMILLLAVAGWRLFWFGTDDAYIAFRYCSNLLHGWGLTWNPPPFVPVEGYTSFLWVMALSGVWALTGISPPEAANWLSLACGLGSLVLVLRLLLQAPWPQGVSSRARVWLSFLVFAGIVTNRTFLTWLSSGLETALFNLLVTWWVVEAFAPTRGRGWGARWAGAAALTALARPDGLLLVAATIPALGWEGWWRDRLRGWQLSFSPLLLVAAHLLWRRWYYGFWLPNTYYAKVTGAWPESGWRYAASFAVEYGLWVWAALAGLWLWRQGRGVLAEWGGRLPALAGVTAITLHVAFYTFYVGGDFFEYRVYSHLVPLLFASAGMMTVWGWKGRLAPALATLLLFLVVSWPIPWLHWRQTRLLMDPKATICLHSPVAHAFPPPLRDAVAAYDRWQGWLIDRFVCIRHQEHKVSTLFVLADLPTRQVGEGAFRWEDRVVAAERSVGAAGWVFPQVAIIDLWGLNDRVIARGPFYFQATGLRLMAHQRKPPPGYVGCFHPNISLGKGGRWRVFSRPLSDGQIQECEQRYWEQMGDR